MPNKTEIRCFKRWLEIKDSDEPVAAKGSQWTEEEDVILRDKVQEYGI